MNQHPTLAVIGLGYVGLPLAIAFAESGCRVMGADASPARVAELRVATSPIDDITNDRLRAVLGMGLEVHLAADAPLAEAKAVFVRVPTPITDSKDPELRPVLSVAEMIRPVLRAGQLIVLQSTTFPGLPPGPSVRPSSETPACWPVAATTWPSRPSG